MTESNLIVTENVVVSLDYVLTLDNDREIDRSEEGTPLEYLHGHKNIIPGLESKLEGLSVGDEKKVTVPPKLGYGERDPESVAEYPHDTFPASLKLEVGEPVRMRDSESGESIEAHIVEIQTDTVSLDFNHPLAGETLHFLIKIAGLREATGEELSHGHVHQPRHNH
ncbi:MAG TPA: peptidylprolyl isomerase [Anaerolineales bacterium]|nr:peptidylprolyl isomerase [Anaerolineales bacterium]